MNNLASSLVSVTRDWQTSAQMLRQLEFWDEEGEPEQTEPMLVADANRKFQEVARTLLANESAYVPLKRVSLVHEGTISGRPKLTSTNEARAFFATYWAENPANDQERFVVACLDTKHRVQCVVVVTIGTLDTSLVHPREVFKPAMIQGSSAVILSHNHPSGDTTPSREDHEVTNSLTEAGKLIGITVLDHIIHGDGTNDTLSIRESS